MANLSTVSGAAPVLSGNRRVLLVPGVDGSDAMHWQTLWERDFLDSHRVNLGDVAQPRRNSWVTHLHNAIEQSGAPTVLVGHSLGSLAIAWWAAMAQPKAGDPVIGALLVAPPDVDHCHIDPRLSAFAPAPIGLLPFPSIVVASTNDPYASTPYARRLAQFWGSEFVDAGNAGHINSESGLGRWDEGRDLVDRIVGRGSGESPNVPALITPRGPEASAKTGFAI